MTKEEMAEGFARGRQLTQESWADRLEIIAVNELIAEGRAVVIDNWRYLDTYQCERRIVRGIRAERA